jgi:glycosyltransferase involved in cell wall biosynthesis
MQIDVAICTWNRAALLRRTLTRFVDLSASAPPNWRLIVVNNNCTDQTDAVINEFQAQLPLHRVFESQPGLSFARNAAIAASTGDILAWTDDDVIVDDKWLQFLIAPLIDGSAELTFGRSRPVWENDTPKWYTEQFAGYFALLDYGPTAFRVKDKKFPFYGLNFALTRATLDRLGPFRVDYGPIQSGGGLGDDIDMFYRALAAGVCILYEPKAVVDHIIPADRSVKRVQRQKAWVGSEAYLRWLSETTHDIPTIAGIPRYFYRMAARDACSYLLGAVRRDPKSAFYHELRLLRFFGMIRAAHRSTRRQVAQLQR